MGASDTKVPGTGRELLPAYLVCVVVVLSGAAWSVLTLTHVDTVTSYRGFHYAVQNLLLGFGFSLAGMLFLSRRSGKVFGWLLLTAGASVTVADTLLITIAVGLLPASLAWPAFLADLLFYTLFALLLLTQPVWLPDGRLRGVWARGYVLAMLVLCVAQELYLWSAVIGAVMGVRNPMARGAWADFWTGTEPVMGWVNTNGTQLALALALLVLAARMVLSADYRRETWWVSVPHAVWALWTLLTFRVAMPDSVDLPLRYAAAVTWPLCLGYLTARARTWYLDRAARRILAVLLLTFLLLAAATAVAGILLWLAPHTGEAGRLLPACALGLVLGVLLRPTYHWAQRVMDHYFYGDRAHPYQVVRNLAERLNRAPDPGDTPQLLGDTVVRTLGLPAASVTVDTHHGPRELVRIDDPGPNAEHFPIVYRGEEIGRLTVAPRAGELALDPQDREAVQVLAEQAAPALAGSRLHQDLQSSREQLIHAREEERRRLRHELHDGLGPALSGLRLQVDAVRRGASAQVAQPLSEVSGGIGYAIKELRHITDGLAPAALDGADLTRALQQLAAHLSSRSLRIGVAVDPDPLPPLPAALQVAVYRIASEALNNVVRHSHADWAQALVSASNGRVTLRISDNGDGFPSHRDCPGVGLRSMAQRSEELGGSFALTSSVDGTVVDAAFPAGYGTGSGRAPHASGATGTEDS
ncbi:GAF domain-containing sensor histidine kinase [Streptomyces acidiscabies]|uniref:GAF domain-containing sensor histidine kinase n=1 Tax=Streptomyces acidiscabies TaxID=42234 RepID=UPI0009528344|nr:histidine kinase [Streptomyces acidiscabies]GAV44546.1 sensor histidine kinase LiaS [Streptomyces acidiscabies]